ncbi:MAG TPA: hypothetical protein ENK14_12455 [Caldithrix sp.]|nr:hypothetical protein [Caldithrix sp.]
MMGAGMNWAVSVTRSECFRILFYPNGINYMSRGQRPWSEDPHKWKPRQPPWRHRQTGGDKKTRYFTANGLLVKNR